MSKSNHITVLGAGISGISSAILLCLRGYEVTIVSELFPLDEEYDKKNPKFQTVIAAASIIPHTVVVDDIESILNDSQDLFKCFLPEGVVRTQHHYEIFETPQDEPAYKDSLQDFAWLTQEELSSKAVPRRSGATEIFGWQYEAYFAEMPLYIARLYELYESIGGQIEHRKIAKEDLENIEDKIIVNCLGSWSNEIFGGDFPSKYYRGYLVLVEGLDIPKDDQGRIFSYNYTPCKEVYQTKSGEVNDVYFYPRADTWIIGGSRHAGNLTDEQGWEGDETSHPTIDIGGVDVPKPIIDLSRDVLLKTTGEDILDHEKRAVIGYRFETNPARIETEQVGIHSVVHNYGHGGAGVTISWGSAIRVLELVQNIQAPGSRLILESNQPDVLLNLSAQIEKRFDA